MKNRFYVASEKLHEIAAELIDNGFEELDECVSPDELADKLFIDAEKKSFYFTDGECLEQANLIIIEKHKCTYKSTTLKKIKEWKQK